MAWMQKREPEFKGSSRPLADDALHEPVAQRVAAAVAAEADHELRDGGFDRHVAAGDRARLLRGGAAGVARQVDEAAQALRDDHDRHVRRARVARAPE